MASGPITSRQIGETMETVTAINFFGRAGEGFKITADGDCSHD